MRSRVESTAIVASLLVVGLLTGLTTFTPGVGQASLVPAVALAQSGTPEMAWVATPISWETGAATGGTRVGAANLAQQATITVSLPHRDPSGLAAFDQAVSTLGSPSYGHFLTLQQFDARYAPSAISLATVENWLTGRGLSIAYVSSDRTTIVASGSLAEMSASFGVSFSNYETAQGGTYWAPDSAPRLPPSVAPWVSGIAGLTDRPSGIHPEDVAAPAVSVIRPLGNGVGVQDSPVDNHAIFQLDPLYNSTGNATAGVQPSYPIGAKVSQTLWAARGDCGYSTTDMNTFFNASDGYPTGVPKPIIQPHYSVPGYVVATPPATGACGDTELTLDMQYSGTDGVGAYLDPTWVSASKGGVSNAGLEALLSWLLTNVPDLTAITQSWGGQDVNMTAGSFEAIYESDYQTATALGISLFASSADGDGTLSGTCAAPGTPGLDYPGSSPQVMSVGGAANYAIGTNTAADLSGTDVWNWCSVYNSLGGSQGGVSAAFPKPAYQIGYAVNSSMANAIAVTQANGGTVWSASSARPDPDWSGPGANMELYVNAGWLTGYGGTSFSSPATAGMTIALEAFDGHLMGPIGPAWYSLMYRYLKGNSGLLPPSYRVENGSNAWFAGATNYNTSTGYGVPMAFNLAQDLGKPWVATNPEGEPQVGANYALTATVKDIQPVRWVNASYLAPGGTWSNVSLSLASGTATNGVWSGAVPGIALTTTGTLQYCLYATDQYLGNSWSPYNRSAWVATGVQNPTNGFGCTVPFKTYVAAAAGGGLNPGTVTLNRTLCETTCSIALNATYTGGTSTYSAAIRWDDGSATQTITGLTGLVAFATHHYLLAGSFTPKVFINDSAAHAIIESPGSAVTVDAHLAVSSLVPSTWRGPTPANETFSGGVASLGSGGYTYAWTYPFGNTSAAAGGAPFQIYLKPGNYTVSVAVTDSLGYHMGASVSFSVWGNSSSSLALLPRWNLVGLPLGGNDYSLFELSLALGAPLLSLEDLHGAAATPFAKGGATGNTLVPAGDALWVDLSASSSLRVFGTYGTTVTSLYAAGAWSGIGWSIASSSSASVLAGLTGATAVSFWDASTQTWSTYVVGFDSPGDLYDQTLSTGTAVYLWDYSSGSFAE